MSNNLRDDMMYLKGQLEAMSFPFVIDKSNWQAYGDLVESIQNQYESMLQRIFKDYENNE